MSDDEPAIVDEATKEEYFGWVFFYNSRRYLETKKISFALAGNGPVVVDGASGTVTILGSAGGVDHQLSEYRRQKKPIQPPQPTTDSSAVSRG
ncbi:YrhB domain-containing protein [Actomonas aquatica]|uniref:YrhB domain-containing protein n=1 Tax=Actomonas aquatica TaxID=2866162 RepID=A0ABZ1CEX9_9BACT|nr:YrhB domain-containing protein [Opitutus sp. WL0086]WRQ88839.1 YrhB domain-containing protein [Opitutus sp. WL0086]WRQ88845.1 YrhB domain-containing protein [Opitutus sp. WL0086]